MPKFGSSSDSPCVRIPPPLFYVAGLLGAWLMERAWPTLPFTGAWPAAWILVGLGGGLALWCVVLFKLAGTALRPSRPSSSLVTQGPYRISRNPIYLGFTLLALGLAWLKFPVWGTMAVSGSAACIHYLVILREEAYLQGRFGKEYETYCRAVRRWL